MRIVVRHTGFVRGQPARYRHVGEMPIFVDTTCDIREFSAAEAPVVAILEDLSEGLNVEYRHADGAFVRPLMYSSEILDISAKGAVGFGTFGGDFEQDYRKRCDWRRFSSGSVGREVVPRELFDWNASNIDDSDAHVFASAIRVVMDRLVMIDGRIWERCFEPCISVRWKKSTEGAVRGGIAAGDVQFLHGPMGAEAKTPFGIRITLPTALNHLSEGTISHERCFSLNETDRISDFLASFKGGFIEASPATTRLRAVDASFCSPDFEALELGRSARLLIASWSAMERELKKATKSRWKKEINNHEFDGRSANIEFALRDLENGTGSPDDLLDAMRSMQQGLEWVAGAAKSRMNVDVTAWLAPVYYGDTDNMTVELAIGAMGMRMG